MSKYFSKQFKDELFPLFAAKSGMSERTARNYLRECKKICDYCQCDFLNLERTKVQAYFTGLKKGEVGLCKADGTTYSKESIAIKLAYMKAIAVFLVENELAENYYPPFALIKIDQPREKVDADKILSLDTIRDILNKTSGTDVYYMIKLAFVLGMSPKRLISLKTTDYREDANGTSFLTISRNHHDNDPQKLAIPAVMKEEFDAFYKSIPGSQVTLFANTKGNPLTFKTLQRYIKSGLAKAGYKNITIQQLRTNSAVYYMKNGVPADSIAKQLGTSERNLHRYEDVFTELSGQASESIAL